MPPSQAVKPHLFREVLGGSGIEVLGFREKEFVIFFETFFFVVLIPERRVRVLRVRVVDCFFSCRLEKVIECIDGGEAGIKMSPLLKGTPPRKVKICVIPKGGIFPSNVFAYYRYNTFIVDYRY